MITLICICLFFKAFGQEPQNEIPDSDQLLKELSENACKCIDSISVNTKSNEEITKEIHRCIDEQIAAYQVGKKLVNIADLAKNAEEKDGKKQINIDIVLDKNSKEYQSSYFEMERHLMQNCKAIKDKASTNNKQTENSYSKDPKAMEYYSKGLDEFANEDYKKAVENFEAAVKIDPKFVFAWDNLGVCYRKIENYDKALEAYEKSLEIDPNGTMPLQNIAIVYQYKKEYKKAIKAYDRLAELDKNNPEVYYGIGHIYTNNLNDLEKGLDNMCKAYNLYIAQKSPYRTDAENMINQIYSQMKKQRKVDKFNEILKANNITPH